MEKTNIEIVRTVLKEWLAPMTMFKNGVKLTIRCYKGPPGLDGGMHVRGLPEVLS